VLKVAWRCCCGAFRASLGLLAMAAFLGGFVGRNPLTAPPWAKFASSLAESGHPFWTNLLRALSGALGLFPVRFFVLEAIATIVAYSGMHLHVTGKIRRLSQGEQTFFARSGELPQLLPSRGAALKALKREIGSLHGRGGVLRDEARTLAIQGRRGEGKTLVLR
jgi:hypothetical protein